MKDFAQRLRNEIPDEIRNLFINAVQKAYDTAIDAYDTATGSNNSTFGHDLYWFCVHELKATAEPEESPIELIRERPDFRLRIGSCILACHRVGTDPGQDIATSFPNNNRAAGQLARSNFIQMVLPGFENDGPSTCRGIDELNIVLAHIGNPNDGVCSIYLCVPIHEENGRIMNWGHSELLWKTDNLDLFTSSTQELPEEAPIEPATVRLKPRKKEEKTNGGDL
jgi:hypothetical protein